MHPFDVHEGQVLEHGTKAHRDFLDDLRNAPSSVRSFIEDSKATLEESMWYALAGAFNACILTALSTLLCVRRVE